MDEQTTSAIKSEVQKAVSELADRLKPVVDENTKNAIKVEVQDAVTKTADKDRKYFDRLLWLGGGMLAIVLSLAAWVFNHLLDSYTRYVEEQVKSLVDKSVIEGKLSQAMNEQVRLRVDGLVSTEQFTKALQDSVKQQSIAYIDVAVRTNIEDKIAAAVTRQVNAGALSEEKIRAIVASSVQSAATLVPEHTVAAFNAQTCPAGWQPFVKGAGRYIVGVIDATAVGKTVGQPFVSDGENRPAGRHAHEYTDNTVGGNGSGIKAGGDYPRPVDKRMTAPNDAPEGTNAPYVELLICERQ